MSKVKLPPTEYFYQRAMKRSAAIKLAAALGMELEAVELAIRRVYFVVEREDLEQRVHELNKQIKELNQDG